MWAYFIRTKNVGLFYTYMITAQNLEPGFSNTSFPNSNPPFAIPPPQKKREEISHFNKVLLLIPILCDTKV